jgi:membrane-associated phospholipid phosphatase
LGRRRRSTNPALRGAVRGVAVAAVAAAVVVPLIRRRARVRPVVTTAACVAGPMGLAVLAPRTKLRDAAVFGLQMWAFTIVHELPYDDPEGLRRRLRVRYPITLDRVLGAGELPGVRLQRALARRDGVTALDRVLAAIHWVWFFEPHAALAYVLARHDERFARAARQMAATYDLGCALYSLVPTAPPWWASEEGHLDAEVERIEAEVERSEPPPRLRRLMVDVGERAWGRAWPTLYDSLGGNPWAAMPSLHFATSLMAALLLAETGTMAGAAGWGYALTLGFALVYLGEHYVTDLIAGAALVVLVRRGEPVAEPLALRFSDAVQRLEGLANP